MAITANTIIVGASELAQDEGNVVWEADQALAWVNDAQRAVASVRADAVIDTDPLLLVPGTKQEITGRRLMSIGRNLGPDQTTPGPAIRLVDRGMKDDFNPDWHTDDASTEILEYMYDARSPKLFYVWPPVHPTTDVYIEATQSVDPTDCTSASSPIDMDDIYGPALIEWVAYRFFCRDAEEVPDVQRAVRHFTNFFQILGAKMQADMAVNPKVREQLN